MASPVLHEPTPLVPATAPPSTATPPSSGSPVRDPAGGASPKRWSLELLGAAYDRLDHDDGDGLAAGIAFGALLSIAPLLLLVLVVTSAFLGEGSAREQIEHLVADSLGEHAVSLVAQWITDARHWSGTATAIGIVTFLIGAARLVGFVEGAFRVVFDLEPPEKKPSFADQVRGYFTTRLKTMGVTLVAGLLMVASLLLRAIGESVLGVIETWWLDGLWVIGREMISFLVWVVALCVVYWALPPVKLEKADVLHGALVSALLVEATLLALRTFASLLGLGAAYGAAGAIVATLLTLYIVSELFLFGAELTAELAARRGQAVRSSRDGCPKRVAPIKRTTR